MATDIFKNHLCKARMKLGLSQRHVAAVLGLKSAARVCALEQGRSLPTARDCVAFQVLFKRSFEELWPLVHLESEASADLNIRRLIQRLQQKHIRTARKRAHAKAIVRNLAIIVDGLPEDFNELI
jgi:transcriptional regulator with XRE-family HTH domain